jgi:hypothetical protein
MRLALGRRRWCLSFSGESYKPDHPGWNSDKTFGGVWASPGTRPPVAILRMRPASAAKFMATDPTLLPRTRATRPLSPSCSSADPRRPSSPREGPIREGSDQGKGCAPSTSNNPFLVGNRKFESTSLQQRVCKLSVPHVAEGIGPMICRPTGSPKLLGNCSAPATASVSRSSCEHRPRRRRRC